MKAFCYITHTQTSLP